MYNYMPVDESVVYYNSTDDPANRTIAFLDQV